MQKTNRLLFTGDLSSMGYGLSSHFINQDYFSCPLAFAAWVNLSISIPASG